MVMECKYSIITCYAINWQLDINLLLSKLFINHVDWYVASERGVLSLKTITMIMDDNETDGQVHLYRDWTQQLSEPWSAAKAAWSMSFVSFVFTSTKES